MWFLELRERRSNRPLMKLQICNYSEQFSMERRSTTEKQHKDLETMREGVILVRRSRYQKLCRAQESSLKAPHGVCHLANGQCVVTDRFSRQAFFVNPDGGCIVAAGNG